MYLNFAVMINTVKKMKNNTPSFDGHNHPLFLIENDIHNAEIAKSVSLAVAVFHVPLLILDFYRMFYDKALFAKPGFSGITIVHIIYLAVFSVLYMLGRYLLKNSETEDRPTNIIKVYWRLFLYSTLTYAAITSPLCHLMHGNTTTYFVAVMGMAAALRLRTVEFLSYLIFTGVVTLGMLSGIVLDTTVFTGYFLDFFTVSVIAVFINGVVGKKALDSFNYKKSFEREYAEKIISKEAGEAKTLFLANMSHEIRTPFAGLKGMLSLLKDSRLDEDQNRYLDNAINSSDILIDIVDDILDLSIVNSGNVVVEEEPFDFRSRLLTAFENTKKSAENKNINLSINIDPAVPQIIVGDPLRIFQVISNLLSNAVKFTEKGTITIKTEIVLKDIRNEKMIYFEVKDTGVGISENEIEKLFESFYQKETGFKKKHQGAGLGLSIAKKLVDQMGGTISATSNPDKGSVFWFEIPLKTPEKTQEIKEPSLRSDKCGESIEGLKVLIVEDNIVNRELLSKFITNEKGIVKTAGTGLEGVEIFKSDYFDAVIMDIQMPVMDGIEATRLIKEFDKSRNRNTPVIALTAYAMKGDKQKFLNEGMDSYLSKPVKKENLIKEIVKTIKELGNQ